MLDDVGVLVAITLGMFGAMFSVFQFVWNRKEKERDKQEALKEKERDKQEALKEKERDRLLAEKEKERDKQEAERKDRLLFLSGVIMDKSIGKSARQEAYNEYIRKGGNSVVVKVWLEEFPDAKLFPVESS